MQAQPLMSLHTRTPDAAFGQVIPAAIQALIENAKRMGVYGPTLPPVVIHHSYSEEDADIEVGLPIERVVDGSGLITCTILPAGPVASVLHVGPYEELGIVNPALAAWIEEQGYETDGPPRESFLTDWERVASPFLKSQPLNPGEGFVPSFKIPMGMCMHSCRSPIGKGECLGYVRITRGGKVSQRLDTREEHITLSAWTMFAVSSAFPGAFLYGVAVAETQSPSARCTIPPTYTSAAVPARCCAPGRSRNTRPSGEPAHRPADVGCRPALTRAIAW